MQSQASEYIRARQTREMLKAGRHAFYLGRPLNWWTTIDFGIQDEGDERLPYTQFSQIRKKLRSWWDYKRGRGIVTGPFLDWVTWEAPRSQLHANWFVHVPDFLLPELKYIIANRCRKVLGELDDDTVYQQEIYGLNGAMFYSLKGTETTYAEKIKIRPSPQGEVWFRRAYAARALGKAARERDWQEGRVQERPKLGIPKPRELREIIRLGIVVPTMAESRDTAH